ncbi:MAG: NADH:ubiquinone reductase (Na(+)-transporting) subunit C [bacterium]
MNKSSLRSLGVLVGVALVCSILVSVATTTLRPIQERNQLLQRYRHIVALTGLVEANADEESIFQVVSQLDARVVDLEKGTFDLEKDPDTINSRLAANNPGQSTIIPTDLDAARLGRRANHEVIYLVWSGQDLSRIIFPVSGQGMWSTLYGYIALESDLSTIGAATFYEQAETAGLGDQIEDPIWSAQWQGRSLFNESGKMEFRVAGGAVDPTSSFARFEVDGLTGATITGAAVTSLVRYWFGPHGYGPLLARISERSPER